MAKHPSFMAVTGALCAFAAVWVRGADGTGDEAVRALAEQNRKLQEQLQAQQKTIENLSAQMDEMRRASERQGRELQDLQQAGGAAAVPAPDAGEARLRISGEAGMAFFKTGSAGQFPHSEFRIDDAKLLVEAKVLENVYAVSEIDLLTRETTDDSLYLATLFAEFEDLGARWGAPGALNVRVGRFAIPFGEEYQVRGVVENPLISHSVADVWGFDNGVETYGGLHGFTYVAALQNGGANVLHDFNSDKSVAARVGYAPASWLRVSASAMRTGDLSVKSDTLSAVWFGNAFFRSIGGAATTSTFRANLYEFDATGRWRGGNLTAMAGWADYDDDDTAADNSRRLSYWSVEGVQDIGDGLYGVARYSEVRAPKGYPLAGLGNSGTFFYNPFAALTDDLSRLSLGLGYRIGPPLVLKLEYSRERGRQVNGAERDKEDMLSTEIGMKF
ncbi:MAG TPA: hypothetical protein VG710_11160 [Opitutus sp.]|nr:hypothetical protein [Opitutus sp.]